MSSASGIVRFHSARQPRSSLRAAVSLFFARWRSRFLMAMLGVSSLAVLAFLITTLRAVVANETIHSLRAKHDVSVSPDWSAEVLLAKVAYLLDHDNIEGAQPYIEAIDSKGNSRLAAMAHYNLANSRLRQAFDLIVQSKLDSAGPFVVLARQEYRRSLVFQPDNWDAKFNLDVASRLIRDFPAFERTMGDTVKTDRKKIWTDIPGKPEGLP
jgi:mxaK protein